MGKTAGTNTNKKDSFFKTKPQKSPINQSKNDKSNGFFVSTNPTTKKNPDNVGMKSSKLEQTKNSNNLPVDRKKTEKKPFDKKRWRLQKYSKKYKLEQWEDKRKQAILREYYKNTKDNDGKDTNRFDITKIYADAEKEDEEENDNNINTNLTQPNQQNTANIDDDADNTKNERLIKQNKKSKAFKKARLEFERIKDEKKRQRDEFLRKKAEKDEALKEYKKNKLEKYKKLNRKTKKGQPIMKDRMELLLEKIQQSLNP